jgi:hypothetical protein
VEDMRDYLRKDERIQLTYLKKFIDNIDQMISDWKNNLTKDESRALKTASTWAVKAADSIVNRQNDTTIKTFLNSLPGAYIHIMDKYAMEVYNKKYATEMDAKYELNRDYYKLVELLLHFNCMNCNKCGSKCEIFREFEIHCIPSPDQDKEYSCKYAYELSLEKEAK